MIRVLHVIGAMDRAGAETFIMNIYRAIDRSKVQFDFLVHAQGECDFDEEIRELGGRIFRVPRYNILNKRAYSNAIRQILREHPEDVIVHSHIGSSAPVNLPCAREEGRLAVAHSHRQTIIDSPQNLVFHLVSKPVRGKADWYMACSEDAATSRFGPEISNSDRCVIVRNGIDVNAYARSEALIAQAKQQLDVEGRPVFGHIGRFVVDKTHAFLLDVFERILKQKPDAILLLAGHGELEDPIRQLVARKGISDSVRFLGVRNDIPDVLRAMDVFLFPSLHEGLGIALVEAQTTGLECIASTGVPEEAVFSDRAMRMPLDSIEKWADQALAAYERASDQNNDRIEEAKVAGYDITQAADWLQEFYLEQATDREHPTKQEATSAATRTHTASRRIAEI